MYLCTVKDIVSGEILGEASGTLVKPQKSRISLLWRKVFSSWVSSMYPKTFCNTRALMKLSS